MEEERRKKTIIMWSSIGVLMTLIFVFWLLNFKNVWQPLSGPQGSESKSQWAQIQEEVDQTIAELSVRLEQEASTTRILKDIASSTLVQDFVEETKKMMASSTPSSSSPVLASTSLPFLSDNQPAASSTSENKNNNCPAYIDCMPKIGAPSPCQVPLGCEGFTQIAY